jgi:nicotinamidase/pyrazinamidase
MHEPLVFLDVDTQVDFMLPAGALYVPKAEEIIPNLEKLIGCAREHDIPVLSSADAHPPDDPSFAQWPPHCVIHTPGQRRIPETQFSSPTVVPNRPGAFKPPQKWSRQTIIEKTEYEVSSNPNFEAILSSLKASFGGFRLVVFGVATEYCVRGAALGLRQRGLPVDLVTDAIRPITEEGGRQATDEMLAAGVRLVKTEDVCASVAQGKPQQSSVKART